MKNFLQFANPDFIFPLSTPTNEVANNTKKDLRDEILCADDLAFAGVLIKELRKEL